MTLLAHTTTTTVLPHPPLQVEAAAKEVAKELAVSLEEGASLAARAEKGLEVGCTHTPRATTYEVTGCYDRLLTATWSNLIVNARMRLHAYA